MRKKNAADYNRKTRERIKEEARIDAAKLDAEFEARNEHADAVADCRERRDWKGLRRLREQERERKQTDTKL